MTIKLSTALANAIHTTGIKPALTGMLMYVYSGVEPASADAAIGAAVLMVTISASGGGGPLLFAANPVAGVMEKDSSQVWQGTVLPATTGAASFCRLQLPADSGASSTTAVRLQGDAGVAGKFLNLSSVALTAGAIQKIDYLALAQPLQ